MRRQSCGDPEEHSHCCPYCLDKYLKHLKKAGKMDVDDTVRCPDQDKVPSFDSLEPKKCLLCGKKSWAPKDCCLRPCRCYNVMMAGERYSYCIALSVCHHCFKPHVLRPELEIKCEECKSSYRIKWPMNKRCSSRNFKLPTNGPFL